MGGEGSLQMITVLHRGMSSQMITVLPDLEFVKKFTRPNFCAKVFYTVKTRKLRLFLPAINSENASLIVIRPTFSQN